MNFRNIKEAVIKYFFAVIAWISILILAAIIITLFKEGLPIFKEVSFFDLLLGTRWYPTGEPAEFGMFPLIFASIVVTLGAIFVCVPLGVGSALFIHEIATPKQRAFLKPAIELLAGIPSIIYGFFGMVVVAPFIQNLFNIPVGLCGFTASLILGVMATPTVCSISEDALSYVPKNLKEGSLALGASRWQTLVNVILPAAGSGISTAIILGMSRAFGETMVVLMVAGGAAQIPSSIFDPIRPMTSTIAAEMGESVVGSMHYHALFGLAMILFFTTFLFNLVAEFLSRKYRLKLGVGK